METARSFRLRYREIFSSIFDKVRPLLECNIFPFLSVKKGRSQFVRHVYPMCTSSARKVYVGCPCGTVDPAVQLVPPSHGLHVASLRKTEACSRAVEAAELGSGIELRLRAEARHATAEMV